MQKGALCVLALCVWLLPATARADVSDYLGKPVSSIRLVVEEKDANEPALIQALATKVGRPFSMADVRDSLTHLFSLGRFDDVRVDATLAGNGVALVFALTPLHPVTKIEFEVTPAAPGIDIGELRRAIVDRYGSSPLVSRGTDMARTMTDALVERAFLRPNVKIRVDLHHAPDTATLTFTIDPGERTVIGDIAIDGVPSVPVKDLLGALGLAKGSPYRQNELNARIDRYVESRRKRGYYEAKIVPMVALVEDGRIANLTLMVEPGARSRLVFTGDSLPSDRRADLVPIEREGSVGEDLLEDSTNRIEDFLRAQGYRDAKATYTRETKNGELVITFDVHKGPLYHVTRVDVTGNSSISLDELRPLLRQRENQPFSAARLDSDVAAIEDLYHRRGFASAKAQNTVEVYPSGTVSAEATVSIRIDVREGPRTLVGTVQIVGNMAVQSSELLPKLGLQTGNPYFEPRLRVDSDTIQLEYANRGYQNATVEAAPNFSADRTVANPVFTVREGPLLFVDHVVIIGNVRTSTATIQRELRLKPGDPFGLSAVDESRRRLATLGLFRRVMLTQVRHGDETKRDLLVTVEEAPATTIGIGGGFEVRLRVVSSAENAGAAVEKLEVAPQASFQIGRRNVFGKNRSVNLFTSISVYPNDSPILAGQPNASTDTGYGFTAYRVIGTYREPKIFNTEADGLVTGTLQQQIRSSFDFAQQSANAELSRKLTPRVAITGGYQIQKTRVFNSFIAPTDQLLVDRLFPQVRLSLFSATVSYDTRDDAIDPSRGQLLSATGWLSAVGIGSEVGFTKSLMTAQGFKTLPGTRHVVLAARAVLGLADPFPRSVVTTDALGNSTVQTIEDLPAAERFFAGGDTTVRGYALDTLATPETRDQDGFPIGGNAMTIFNVEARVPVWRGVGVVGFIDTGNVFAHANDISLGQLRTAVGFGLRYKSPVGPLRIDLGFKLQREEIAPGVREGLTALHISFGQAF
jgi:outer membrane protein assembly complex protein YaeT